MAVYKRGGTYWFHFVFDGKHIQKSAKTSNKRTAEQIEAAFKVKLAKGEVDLCVEKKPVPTFPIAIKEFLAWSKTEHATKPATTRRYETSSKALLKYFNDTPIDKIDVEKIEKFKQWRIQQNKKAPALKLKKNKKAATVKTIKPATVNRELACLKIIFNHFIKADVIVKNPVSYVKFLAENNEQMRVLSEAEEALYLSAASQPLRDVAILMLETGMRPEEVARIERKNVNLENGYLLNPFGKTKAAKRKIPLSSRAIEVLSNRLGQIEGNWLFPSVRGDKSKPIVKLNNAHNGALKRSGIEKCRLYDLRHTFATRATESGVDLVTLAALLGHSRVQMVMRYAHPTENHQFEAIRKMEARKAAQTA
ncbi:MAG: tyrosine-type recombinase/integrase [Acidobacteriota bacterium]|nr:tyrosine-type recombinase/integrase [Acidobacteriota bacterium]